MGFNSGFKGLNLLELTKIPNFLHRWCWQC